MMQELLFKVRPYAKLVLSIILLAVLMEELGTLTGIFGWFGVMLLLSLPTLWRARYMILNLKHRVECVIWGKPLRQFTKDELKNTKVVMVWNKEKQKNTQKQ